VKTAAPVYKRETHVQDKSSLMSLHNGFSQTVKEITPQVDTFISNSSGALIHAVVTTQQLSSELNCFNSCFQLF